MSEHVDRRRFPMGDLISKRLEEPYYSAPEASLHHLYEGRKADLWSCGIMLVSTQYDSTLDANRCEVLHACWLLTFCWLLRFC